MKTKLVIAGVMALGIAAWMATGEVVVSGAAEEAAVRPPAERSAADDALFRVRARTVEATERQRYLAQRGRTRADSKVEVAAETSGRIIERPIDLGDSVKPDDVLCRLDPGVRAAQLDQAKAEVAKARLDHKAATQLQGRGFESETRVASTKASLDAAEARAAAARQELERTIVRAPISGVVQTPLADKGQMLSVGGICATIVDADPMIFTGEVAERDISNIEVGTKASVTLVTGETIEGEVSYISRTADTYTRTFTVEISLPNPDGALRTGVTAKATIPLGTVRAHRLPSGVLTLSDAGEVGVRTVSADGVVQFHPVEIALQDTEGFWVRGLPDTVTVITVGQDYVVEGQDVRVVMEDGKA